MPPMLRTSIVNLCMPADSCEDTLSVWFLPQEAPKHIPDYLPAFPDKHTCVRMPGHANIFRTMAVSTHSPMPLSPLISLISSCPLGQRELIACRAICASWNASVPNCCGV